MHLVFLLLSCQSYVKNSYDFPFLLLFTLVQICSVCCALEMQVVACACDHHRLDDCKKCWASYSWQSSLICHWSCNIISKWRLSWNQWWYRSWWDFRRSKRVKKNIVYTASCRRSIVVLSIIILISILNYNWNICRILDDHSLLEQELHISHLSWLSTASSR